MGERMISPGLPNIFQLTRLYVVKSGHCLELELSAITYPTRVVTQTSEWKSFGVYSLDAYDRVVAATGPPSAAALAYLSRLRERRWFIGR